MSHTLECNLQRVESADICKTLGIIICERAKKTNHFE